MKGFSMLPATSKKFNLGSRPTATPAQKKPEGLIERLDRERAEAKAAAQSKARQALAAQREKARATALAARHAAVRSVGKPSSPTLQARPAVPVLKGLARVEASFKADSERKAARRKTS